MPLKNDVLTYITRLKIKNFLYFIIKQLKNMKQTELSSGAAQPIELLDARFLKNTVEQAAPEKPFIFEVLPTIDSTNRYLLEKNSNQLHVCLAEQQTAGRGRQGKTWLSPFGVNLYCSLLWPFRHSINQLAGLSLAIGVIVAEMLEKYGLPSIGLKWPNDVFCHNKKIAGVLIEAVSEQAFLHKVVIGIGLNIGLSKIINQEDPIISQPWTDVASQIDFPPRRNEIASLLLKEILNHLPLFEENGFSAFQAHWSNKDMLFNQSIVLKTSEGIIEGMGKGVDKTGRLIVENEEGLHKFNSAEVLATGVPTATVDQT